MMTYRKFKAGDDVPFHNLLMDNAKPWSICNRRLIDLQKEFIDQIWNHYNPYTKLAYKDDPVFVLTEINAECDFFRLDPKSYRDYEPIPYYENEFRELFRDWLQEKGIEYDWANCEFYNTDEPMIQFKIELTRKYLREMSEFMHNEVGIRIPVTGTNWEHAGILHTHSEMDFADCHHYFYDWQWGNTERVCAHRSLSGASAVCPELGKMRLANKPYFISEWDVPWPNSFRAESPIYYAAMGAFQNWVGLCIHTYSYSRRLERGSVLGRELSSPVQGVPYREGIFSAWNDPAKFGLFYHSALIVRRGDVSPANKKIAVTCKNFDKLDCTAFGSGMELHSMASTLEDKVPEGYDMLVEESEPIARENPDIYVSDNGQLWRDLKREIGVVDTERTKVVYGRIGQRGHNSLRVKKTEIVEISGMTVSGETDFGVIALSSLTDDPIEKSDNMLLSAIGRARNEGAQFDGIKMLEVGKGPIMAEVVRAKIALKSEIADQLVVWGINAEGFYSGRITTTAKDGVLYFEIGDDLDPACYYLIVKE